MTIRKILALTATVCLFWADSHSLRAYQDGSEGTTLAGAVAFHIALPIVSTIVLFSAVTILSRNVWIATGASLWWLLTAVTSLLLNLATTIDVDDMGISNGVCLLGALITGAAAVTLWFGLPWNPLPEVHEGSIGRVDSKSN